MLDNIFIQLAMGAAALITFLGSLSLLGAVNQYLSLIHISEPTRPY